eukprot:817436-Prymnesium_polylepis.2
MIVRHFRRFVRRCQALSGAVRHSDCQDRQDRQAVIEALTGDAGGTSHICCRGLGREGSRQNPGQRRKHPPRAGQPCQYLLGSLRE